MYMYEMNALFSFVHLAQINSTKAESFSTAYEINYSFIFILAKKSGKVNKKTPL